MKIQLQSLRVVNCGPLRDDCIQFNTIGESPTTVLAGANGSGKTTILKCITALYTMLDVEKFVLPQLPGMLSGLSLEDPPETYMPATLAKDGYIQIDMSVDKGALSLFYGQQPSDNNLPTDYYGYTLSNKKQRNPIVRGETASLINVVAKSQLGLNRAAIIKREFKLPDGRSVGKLPSILYFPHDRSLSPIVGQQVQREEVPYQWVYSFKKVRSFAGSLDSYLIWLDYAETEVYEAVIDFLDSLDFDGKKFGVQRKELRAVVTTRDGQTHGVAELSSGEQNILIMLLELRRRLLPYSIVLIDEIENSLHPAFQHRLGQALKKMQAEIPFQLIVTTHSSEFARIFGPESVRILTEF